MQTLEHNMNKEIANFFWIGPLTVYEKNCMQSFVKHNFIVKVWSFDEIHDLPSGVKWNNASEIISKDLLHKVSNPMYALIDNKKDNHSNYAAISDIFRTYVGDKVEGWYFDADCFCLKDEKEFKSLRQNKPFVMSYQDKNSDWYIANGVIFATHEISQLLSKVTEEKCLEYNYAFPEWTFIGPTLVSNTIKENNLNRYMGVYSDFYAIHWGEMNLFLDPNMLHIALDKTKDSYITHLWNSQLNQSYDIKNKLPPEGSYIDYLFKLLENNMSSELSNYRVSQIKNLYSTILLREADFDGLNNYVNSQLSIEEIKNILLRSDEYGQLARDKQNIENIFSCIYAEDRWTNGSGPGSTPEITKGYREVLIKFIQDNNIKTVLDYGCGDWQFSKLIDWESLVDSYLGVDVVESVIEYNKLNYETHKIKFKTIKDDWKFENVDLIICKEVLIHLPNDIVRQLLDQMLMHGKHLLFTHCYQSKSINEINSDCIIGGWRPINLNAAPWNLTGVEIYKQHKIEGEFFHSILVKGIRS